MSKEECNWKLKGNKTEINESTGKRKLDEEN